MAWYSKSSGLVFVLLLAPAVAGQDLLPAPADLKVEPADTSWAFQSQRMDRISAAPLPPAKFEAATGRAEIADDSDGRKHLDRAQGMLRQGYFYDALCDVQFRLICDPQCIDALRIRAFCRAYAAFAGDESLLKAAQSDIARVLEKNPSDAPTRAIRGVILFWRHEDIDQAVADLSYGIDHQVDRDMPGYGYIVSGYRGCAFMIKEEYEKAIEDFNRAVSLDPARAAPSWVVASRGRCYAACDRYDEAIADFTTAIEKSPDDPELYKYRAECFAAKDDLARALADHDQIVRLSPDKPEVYVDRSIVRWNQGDDADSMADVDRVLELMPKASEAYFYRSVMSMLVLHDRNRSLADLNRAIALESRYPIYYALRAFIHGREMKLVPLCKAVALCAVTFNQFDFRFWYQIDDRRRRLVVGVCWAVKDGNASSKTHGSTVEEQCLELGVEHLIAATFGSAK